MHARLVDDDRVIDDLVARGTAQGVELHVHGGEAVVLSVCATLEAAGSRPSTEPDTGDLPGSLRHARALASSRWGELARLAHEARLAVARGTISPALRGRLESVQARRMLARHLRSPPVVRLVGRPNAGKSTLFNALLSDDRALVSPREGTTRDTVSALLVLADAPVRLEDTAGVCGRQPDCAGADLVVHVLESDEPCPGEDATGVPTLHVRGKSDLRPTTDDVPRVLALSGRTRLGLDELLSRIAHALALDGDARDDVLAPVDPRLERLWDDALALPDEASEGA